MRSLLLHKINDIHFSMISSKILIKKDTWYDVMTKHNTRITALNVLTGPWHLYRPIDFIVQISFKSIYKEHGAVIDGMYENWHHITTIILDWTSVKTIKNSLHFIYFFNFIKQFLSCSNGKWIHWGGTYLNERSKVARTCTKSHKVGL